MTAAFSDLVDIMRRLRDPQSGCPWDLEQTFETIAPYTLEEAYEVAEAIATGDRAGLREELGDLLLQVVFHAQMAADEGSFGIDDVIGAISAKMIRRHPHVFGDAEIASADAQTDNWETIKAQERAEKAAGAISILADVPLALPALVRAEKLAHRAARVGFDWPDAGGVLAKIREELAEVEQAVTEGYADHIAEEVGDVLFAVANLARKLGVDAEAALRAANRKFTRRFQAMEVRAGTGFEALSLDEKEALWQAVKREETPAAKQS